MPLCPIRDDNGPTQFWLGSHRRQLDALPDDAAPDVAAVEADVGDAVLFDGKVLHRGGAKRTDEARHVLYVVFKKCWYTDEAYPVVAARVGCPDDAAKRPRRRAMPAVLAAAAALALALAFAGRRAAK